MYKNVLQSIGGVEVYAIFSMLLFIGIFTAMILIVLKARTSYMDRMAHLPLEGDDMPLNGSTTH